MNTDMSMARDRGGRTTQGSEETEDDIVYSNNNDHGNMKEKKA
jgi:hypothetical protein